jgi:uncharacterized protein (TIGR03118 family)
MVQAVFKSGEAIIMTEMKLRPIGQSALATALILLAGTAWSDDDPGDAERFYSVHPLVSDGALPADHVDPSLRNSWGIAFNPNGAVWVADNRTNTATLYDGTGTKVNLGSFPEVHLPSGSNGDAAPTGIVFNSSSDFAISPGGVPGQGGTPAASAFIFAGENGTIMGWSPTLSLGNAFLAHDDKEGGAVYKGLALAQNGQGNFLYATDFHNGKIDVFDRTFTRVTLPGMFKDTDIPQGYAPFGIRNIQGNLYVTFAKQDANRQDDVRGVGLGFVDVFDANGNLIRRVATHGNLNAPWGLALAPADFGRFSHRLLVGNFGDGTIDAFDPATGAFLGQLHATNGQVLKIDNLWGLSFGNGLLGQPANSLFFTSGPGGEQHGLYGRIDAAPMSDGHEPSTD